MRRSPNFSVANSRKVAHSSQTNLFHPSQSRRQSDELHNSIRLEIIRY